MAHSELSAPAEPPPHGMLGRAMAAINRVMTILGMLALVAASLVLTHSVISRHYFGTPTDWQDQIAVFCLIGAVFLSSAYVQSTNGHVAIETLTGLLPDRVNRARILLVRLISLIFCAFFAWKSWTLTHEAWEEDYRLASSFEPPLAIPYVLMSAGMTLLCLQLALQCADSLRALGGKERTHHV